MRIQVWFVSPLSKHHVVHFFNKRDQPHNPQNIENYQIQPQNLEITPPISKLVFLPGKIVDRRDNKTFRRKVKRSKIFPTHFPVIQRVPQDEWEAADKGQQKKGEDSCVKVFNPKESMAYALLHVEKQRNAGVGEEKFGVIPNPGNREEGD